MMKAKLFAAAVACSLALPAQAASEDECAIWLCITVGFAPSECQSARVAMYKRLLEFKSPLPSFGSCSVDGANTTNLDYAWEPASVIYPRRWDPAKGGRWTNIPNIDVPGTIVDGGRCDDLSAESLEGDPPMICATSLSAVTLFENGLPLTDTYCGNDDNNPYRYDRSDYVRDLETGEIRLADTPAEPVIAPPVDPLEAEPPQ